MTMLPGARRRLLCLAFAASLLVPGVSRALILFSAPGFVEDVVASGLPYATAIAFAADGRMFVALKGGVVRVYQDGALLPTPFLDISDQTADSTDRGLLGIAVHPDFPSTPYLYLLYTWNPPGYSTTAAGGRVARLIRVEADPAQNYNRALPGSTQPQTVPGGPGHRILLGTNSTAANIGDPVDGRDTSKASCMVGLSMAGPPIEDCIPSDEDSHTIGTVAFGLDGSLFVSAGDGANYVNVDPRALRSIDTNSLAGKILRIDPDTGLGRPDNPFFDASCPQCNRSKVYSKGLRNPFRFAIHPLTNEPYVGEVGWTTWEEINTGKGANFGWPCYEGGTAGSPAPVESGITVSLGQPSYAVSPATSAACQALYAQGPSAVRAPIFSYNHAGTDGAGGTGGASANAGAFYTGATYPAAYQNALFILDYNRRWIRYLTFDAQGRATVHNFGRESVYGMVQVLMGPDGNLYAVVLAPTGSEVRRIRYVAGGNTPPTAVADATPTIGVAPLAVTFSGSASFDPDAQPLSYAWSFGDGGTSTLQDPSHTYTASGVYTATLTVTELTAPFATRTDEVLITVGNDPPLAVITTPADGTTYAIGDAIPYAGTGSAGGDPVDPSQLAWNLRLHHNEHLHYIALPGGTGGTLDITEHGDNTYFDLCLTVTVPPTLTDTRCVGLLPRTTDITLTTSPPGLLVNYDDEGVTQASPFLIHPVVGSVQTASVPLIQGALTFQRWTGNVLTNSRQFVVGDAPATYTAEYVNRPPVAVAAASPTSGPAPLQVTFTGSGSSDPDLGTLGYAWSFGDGGVSSAPNPVHEYAAPGTYQAMLTVTDPWGTPASQPVSIVVGPASPLCGNGQLNPGEQCDGGACCTAGCQFRAAGTVCRAGTQACDSAETCSGASAACPADVAAPNGAACDDGVSCTVDACFAGVCESAPACGPDLSCNAVSGLCQGVPATVFGSAAPSGFAGSDVPLELGVKFYSDVPGYVTGVRFFKNANNTGPHVGNLWSIGGERLATAVFSNETASGWQRVDFVPPVAIEAQTTYVASYHTTTGYYGFSRQQLATEGVDNPPLHVLAAIVSGGNGVFKESPTSAFPTDSFDSTNYWVDAVFVPAQPGPCEDAIDQDGDGFAAFPDDPGCASFDDLDERSPLLSCDNGVDDDGDGFVDFANPAGLPLVADPVCALRTGVESAQCQDGLDNDGQPGIDYDGGASWHGGVPISTPDPQCTQPYGNREAPGCGLGGEVALLLPILGALRRRRAG